jgi:hypothetical protein
LIVATQFSEKSDKRINVYTGMDVRDVSRSVAGGVEVDIIVSPGSERQGTEGINEWRRCLVIRVRSPPTDGKANREIEEFIGNITECRSEIIRGHMSRQKTILIHGTPDLILDTLEALI